MGTSDVRRHASKAPRSHLAASWQSHKIRRHYIIVPHDRNQKWPKIYFFSMKKQNLSLCTKWELLGRDPAGRVLSLLLTPSFSLGKPHNSQIQLQGTPSSGHRGVLGGQLGGLASPSSEKGSCALLPLPFPLPASWMSLTVGWGGF